MRTVTKNRLQCKTKRFTLRLKVFAGDNPQDFQPQTQSTSAAGVNPFVLRSYNNRESNARKSRLPKPQAGSVRNPGNGQIVDSEIAIRPGPYGRTAKAAHTKHTEGIKGSKQPLRPRESLCLLD